MGKDRTKIAKPKRRRQSPIVTLILALICIVILANLAGLLGAAGYLIYYDGLILPGVSVWGVDLSAMAPETAEAALQGKFDYPQTARITFTDGDRDWEVTTGELGVQFDVSRTAQAAYQVGRSRNPLNSISEAITAFKDGAVVPPAIVYDQTMTQAVLDQISAETNLPVIDAGIMIRDLEVITTPSQIGRTLDPVPTLHTLGELITSLKSGEVPLSIVETQPRIADTEELAGTVRAILAEDLTIVIEEPYPGDPGPWGATRQALADMLIIERVTVDEDTDAYEVKLNTGQFHLFLEPLAPQVASVPVSAFFHFNDETKLLEVATPDREGRTLNIEATIERILTDLLAGQHAIPLVFDLEEPEFPDDISGEELGITELVSSATTYFYGSGAGRRANVREAASRFDGIIIRPGQEFSFNQYLGDVSLETGFEEAYIIHAGRTISGVGGGVCQVSTTAFQAAFYAGFPIGERTPHAYRVSYYETGEGAGMDATVYSPIVDFTFTNDTPYHLLIETVTDVVEATVTFRFYSTSDGRTVQKDGPYISNIIPHGPTVYEESAEMAPGQTKQVDWAVDGADVTIKRYVYRDGELLYEDVFFSRYYPWQAVYLVSIGYNGSSGQ